MTLYADIRDLSSAMGLSTYTLNHFIQVSGGLSGVRTAKVRSSTGSAFPAKGYRLSDLITWIRIRSPLFDNVAEQKLRELARPSLIEERALLAEAAR